MTDTAKQEAIQREVEQVVAQASAAQATIADYTQEQVDELCTAVAWAVARPERAEALAKLAVDEGGFGNYEDKVIKIGKRVGVVAALIPTTGPDATPPMKALFALKGRNAIVMSPHPRTYDTTVAVVGYMREACLQVGAPEDLIQTVAKPSVAKTQELMRQADLIVAT